MNSFSSSSNNGNVGDSLERKNRLEIFFRKRILDKWSSYRQMLLSLCHQRLKSSNKIAQILSETSRKQNLYLHLVTTSIPITISVSVLNHQRDLSLFSFHVILMVAGCLFFSQALVLKDDKVLITLFVDLMRGSRLHKARMLHAALSIIGASLILLGFGFIICNKLYNGFSVFPASLHGLIGVVAILLVGYQSQIGVRKLHNLEGRTPEQRSFRYHGSLGLLLYDFCTLAMISGVCKFLPFFSFGCMLSISGLLWNWFLISSFMLRESFEFDFGDDAEDVETESEETDVLNSRR